MTQTTSPLLPILASLDACRRQMALNGEALLDHALNLAAAAARRLRRLPGLAVLDAARLSLPDRRHDPTRLVVDVHRLGITGFEAERMLRHQFGIAPEMSDLLSVVCLITIGDAEESIDRLVAAFTALASTPRPARTVERPGCRSVGEVVAPGRQVLTPRDAFFARLQPVPLAEAVDEVIGEVVVPYPPGIPVLAPGELVSAAKVEYLRHVVAQGGLIRGAADPSLATVRIVDSPRGVPI
jgi:arginine/lysine/ornithine decarboxylase